MYAVINNVNSKFVRMYRENTCSSSDTTGNGYMEKLANCPIYIGRGTTINQNIVFFVKEFRIWNSALTEDQFLSMERE